MEVKLYALQLQQDDNYFFDFDTQEWHVYDECLRALTLSAHEAYTAQMVQAVSYQRYGDVFMYTTHVVCAKVNAWN